MLAIDVIGLLLTTSIVGVRYPHYVLLASFIHELGRIVIALFLHSHIDSVMAAGAFGTTIVSNTKVGTSGLLIIFSGPLANYIVSSTVGGVEYERTANLFNPFAKLKYPFAIINLRLAIISFLVNMHELF